MAPLTNNWETVKENAAPLARGRNVVQLEKTMTLMTEEERLRAEQTVARYEQRLRADADAATVAGDPLVDWLSYIKFHQETFPTATHEQFLLLERCFRTFCGGGGSSGSSNKTKQQYANDPRFVRVCCLFADKTQEPVTTFQEIYKLGIGHQSATFWNAWAFVAEKKQDYQLAEQIFEKAIRKQAKPLDYILLRQKRFLRRMSRHFLNATTMLESGGEEEEEGRRRGILGSLSGDAVVRNDRTAAGRSGVSIMGRRGGGAPSSSTLSTFTDRSRRSTTAAAPANSSNNNGVPSKDSFAIFEDASEARGNHFLDDSFDLVAPARTDREREEDRWKENRLAAERWNERGSLASTSAAYTQYNHHSSSSSALPSYPRATTPTAFAIHVDQECAVEHDRAQEEHQRYQASHRTVRDERALREHETSVSDTLSHDPLFYVRHPEQVGSVDAEARAAAVGESAGGDRSKDDKKKKGVRSMWKNRLLTGADGKEQCFEEARMYAKCYTVLDDGTSNFNDLAPSSKTSGSEDDNSCMSMSMEELMSVDEESYVSATAGEEAATAPRKAFARRDDLVGTDSKPPASASAFLPPLPDRHPLSLTSTSFLRNNNSSFENPTPRNASSASSTVDEAAAVGAPTGREEQTINTQLALKELSMMFSSPAVDLNDSAAAPVDRSGGLGPILNESASSELRNTSAVGSGGPFETIAEVESDNSDPNGSFAQQHGDSENDGAHNPDARSQQTTPDFDKVALRALQQETSKEAVGLGCAAATARPPPSRTIGRIDQNDPFRGLQEHDLPATAGFEIYSEEGEKKEDNGGDGGFQIYEDNEQKPPAVTAAGTFQIYQDEVKMLDRSRQPTTGFSIFQDDQVDTKTPGSSERVPVNTFQIYDEGDVATNDSDSPLSAGDTACFPDIFGKPSSMNARGSIDSSADRSEGRHSCSSQGDTATFSLMGGLDVAVATSGDSPLESAPAGRALELPSPQLVVGPAVSDFESPKFGDISKIALSEDATMTIHLSKERAIDYVSLHSRDVKESAVRIKTNAAPSLPKAASLTKTLATERLVCDLPSYVLPRPLKQKAPMQAGDHLKIGFSSATVEKELGRGVYGVVVLLKEEENFYSGSMAVKAQAPTGCLAWEYEILCRVEDRIRGGSKSIIPLPFPKALSFVSLADGAMLSMSAGGSGMNLVALVNAYKKLGEHTPEVVAMHYTARMLKHLELLHWHAKVLHCDTKPDNWVLADTEKGTDLMLVDFGRAIDLKSANSDPATLMDTVFTGPAANAEMMCVSMRQDLPWSFDLDTFGICASAHVLLFGAHLEVAKTTSNKTKRWMATRPFPRHLEKELWTELFDTLLNLDPDFGVAIGSRPYSLKRLRTRIENYLATSEATARLKVALERQQKIVLTSEQ